VYQAVPDDGMLAFDAKDGSVVWTARGVTGSVIGVRGGRLVVWNGAELLLLDAARGEVVDRLDMSGIAIVKTDAFVDGNLYTVADRGGRVEKFSPRN
jgi:outer membrane protein assembly factor BamB